MKHLKKRILFLSLILTLSSCSILSNSEPPSNSSSSQSSAGSSSSSISSSDSSSSSPSSSGSSSSSPSSIDSSSSSPSSSGFSSSSPSSSGSSSSISNPEVIYIMTNGLDSNTGTSILTPVLSLQTAVTQANYYHCSNIYIGSGVYNINNSAISNNTNYINISGGWDNLFSNITGYTVYNANFLSRALYVTNSRNLTFANIVIINGGYSLSNGGGILFNTCSNISISNCVISNCTAWVGAGIYFNYCTKILVEYSQFISNKAIDRGAGISCEEGENHTIDHITVANCSGLYDSAINFQNTKDSCLYNSFITNNTSSQKNIIWFQAVAKTITGSHIISNNIIGSPKGTGYMIFNESPFLGVDLINHKIIDNRFLTNGVSLLYANTNSSFTITILETSSGNNYSWYYINSNSVLGTSEAHGNYMQ